MMAEMNLDGDGAAELAETSSPEMAVVCKAIGTNTGAAPAWIAMMGAVISRIASCRVGGGELRCSPSTVRLLNHTMASSTRCRLARSTTRAGGDRLGRNIRRRSSR